MAGCLLFIDCVTVTSRCKLISVILLVLVLEILFFSLLLSFARQNYSKTTEAFNTSHIFDLDFHYLIDNPCTNNSKISTVLVVLSYVGYFKEREDLRELYPQEELAALGMYRVFLLAMFEPKSEPYWQAEVLKENLRFGDIVQGNFLDSYRNLTYKSVMGLRWALTECRQASYVVKMDDDMNVDVYSLNKIIESKSDVYHVILGYKIPKAIPQRNASKRYYVSKEDFEPESFPPYMFGGVYIVRLVSVEKLLVAVKHNKFFWLEDVFLTGILANKAVLRLEDIKRHYLISMATVLRCVQERQYCGVCGFTISPSSRNISLKRQFKQFFTSRDQEQPTCGACGTISSVPALALVTGTLNCFCVNSLFGNN